MCKNPGPLALTTGYSAVYDSFSWVSFANLSSVTYGHVCHESVSTTSWNQSEWHTVCRNAVCVEDLQLCLLLFLCLLVDEKLRISGVGVKEPFLTFRW